MLVLKSKLCYKKHSGGIKLDIGCGSTKMEGHVGDGHAPPARGWICLERRTIPLPLPDESVSLAQSPIGGTPYATGSWSRLSNLCELLVKKKFLPQKESDLYLGEFVWSDFSWDSWMKVWRILSRTESFTFGCSLRGQSRLLVGPKPILTRFMKITFEYGIRPLGKRSWNPALQSSFWHFYKPKPWKRFEAGTPLYSPRR